MLVVIGSASYELTDAYCTHKTKESSQKHKLFDYCVYKVLGARMSTFEKEHITLE